MSLPTINPTTTKAWQDLKSHYETIKHTHLKDLFKQDSERANVFSISWQDFYVDYSKNRIDNTTKKLLLDLADQTGLKEAIQRYFEGSVINKTEERAVLHTALRTPSTHEVIVDGKKYYPRNYSCKRKDKNV